MYDYTEISRKLSINIRDYIKKSGKTDIVFICIGDNNLLQDTIGPLVGSFLTQNEVKNVYGTLNDPINKFTLTNKLKKIYHIHPNAFFIGIDAITSNYLGIIAVKDSGIIPRSGIDDTFNDIVVGDISIQCSTLKVDTNTNKIIDYIKSKDEIILYGQIIATAIIMALKSD